MGRRRLRGGAERLLGHHGGEDGRIFRRCYDALSESYGPFSSQLARLDPHRAAISSSIARAMRSASSGGIAPLVQDLTQCGGVHVETRGHAVDRDADPGEMCAQLRVRSIVISRIGAS